MDWGKRIRPAGSEKPTANIFTGRAMKFRAICPYLSPEPRDRVFRRCSSRCAPYKNARETIKK